MSIKPEILGVGTSVYTADASTDTRASYQVSGGTSFSSPMIAGAAAVLKAARPGLTVERYRSLLINGSSTFSYDGAATAPIQQTGVGLLNLFSSLSSTITASPQTINFGSGSPDVSKAVRLTLSNIGTNDDTYSIAVASLDGGPEPSLSATSIPVPAGEAREISIGFDATRLRPGQYQGFVMVRSSVSDSQSSIPYWYAVPSGEVDQILVADPPQSGRRSSLREIFVRPSDAAGLAVETPVEISVLEGGGSVSGVQPSTSYPGFWAADVRLGPQPGSNVLEIRAGGKTTRLVIVGE
jgi:hypothetical protein